MPYGITVKHPNLQPSGYKRAWLGQVNVCVQVNHRSF